MEVRRPRLAHPMHFAAAMTQRTLLAASLAALTAVAAAPDADAQPVLDVRSALGVPSPRAIDARLVAHTGTGLGVAHGTRRAAGAAAMPGAASPGLPPTFSRRDLAYWGTALAVGAIVYQLDERIVDAMPHPDSVRREDGGLDYAAIRFSSFNEYQAFYGAVALYGYGRIFGKGALAEAGLHASEAALLGKIGMDVGRGLAGRSRPRGQIERGEEIDRGDFEFMRGFKESGYGAFPSRHVTGVSAVASALAFETRHHWPQHSKWVTPLAVATPLAVGLGRIYTGHHWGTDVVAGAALGTWIGWKTVRYTHNHQNNWLDRVLLGK